MKFLKLCAGLGLAVLASISVNASAQTAACTWSIISGYGGPGGWSSMLASCKTSSGLQIASRTDTKASSTAPIVCGTATISSGYVGTNTFGTGAYPSYCNQVIVAGGSSSASSSSVATSVYPGSSCSWVHTSNSMGYDQFDFNCSGYGKVAYKVMGYPWSYSSQGYTCRIYAVSPYKVQSWDGTTSCDVTKVTK